MEDNIAQSKDPILPKKKLQVEGYEYMFQSTKEFIDKYTMHSDCSFNALEYHGYKEAPHTIKHVLEELKYELSVYPQHADFLLDKINEMNKLLAKYE